MASRTENWKNAAALSSVMIFLVVAIDTPLFSRGGGHGQFVFGIHRGLVIEGKAYDHKSADRGPTFRDEW